MRTTATVCATSCLSTGPSTPLDTRRAGGIALADDERVDSLYDLGEIVNEFSEHRRFADLYAGTSPGLQDGWARRLTFGFPLSTSGSSRRLPAAGATTLVPENRKLVYPWVGFDLVEDSYRKLKNHDEIERTEDFFLGTRVTGAWDSVIRHSARIGAPWYSLLPQAMACHRHRPRRSCMPAPLHGRYEDGEADNTVLDAAIRYYVQQSRNWLFFTTLQGTAGHNLDLDNQILLGGGNAMRGYPLRYQGGEARAAHRGAALLH